MSRESEIIKEVAALRESLGLSYRDISKASGLNTGTISRIFAHEQRLTIGILEAICRALGMDFTELRTIGGGRRLDSSAARIVLAYEQGGWDAVEGLAASIIGEKHYFSRRWRLAGLDVAADATEEAFDGPFPSLPFFDGTPEGLLRVMERPIGDTATYVKILRWQMKKVSRAQRYLFFAPWFFEPEETVTRDLVLQRAAELAKNGPPEELLGNLPSPILAKRFLRRVDWREFLVWAEEFFGDGDVLVETDYVIPFTAP